jgi:hypothetical protein
LYSLFPKKERLAWCCIAFKRALSTFHSDRLFLKQKIYLTGSFCEKYGLRLLHTHLYELAINKLFSENLNSTFYTGQNLDRYAIVEDVTSKRYNIKTVNIPHGLEYGFKCPYGFTSDVFYANSRNAAEYLNKLYNTNKFIFDIDVTTKMFKLDKGQPHPKYVVFFTEPRDVYVNLDILNQLKPLLDKDGIALHLKLHPIDKESNYSHLGLDIITDYNMSLTGNICIARKSTILLEAVYNDSISIAIITNVKDQSTFINLPSLNDERIIKTNNVNELYKEIKKNLLYNKPSNF